MNVTPDRRWYRFSLRTLFVLVTVLGCWLGYSLDWIRQRRAVRSDPAVTLQPFGKAPMKAPGMLWMFGEQGEGELGVAVDVPPGRVAAIQKVFPEAKIFPRKRPASDRK